MADFSNKTLAFVLVAALTVSLIGTLLSLNKLNQITGGVTGTGNASLYLNSTASIRFAVATVDWGTGSVNSSGSTCLLDTAGTTTGCTGFSAVSQPLVIENNGDTNLSVQLTSNASGTQFIGSGATFQWKVTNNETSSCPSPLPAAYTDVNTSSPGTLICAALLPSTATNTLKVDLNVSIPLSLVTSATGQKAATLTVTGS